MFYGFLLFLHFFVSICLIVSVLLQSGKGGGLAGSIGGGSMGSMGGVFGGRGAAPFLIKATTILAIVFVTTSFTLALIRPAQRTGSVLERTTREMPAAPSPAPSGEMPLDFGSETMVIPEEMPSGQAGD